jgi:hypothetical protein
MKTKFLFTGLLAIIICSCTSPRYLPSSDKIDVDPYGSYIKIVRKTASNITGELIAIDSTNIVVLSESESKCATIPITDVMRFKLYYAKPKHYGWTIPVYTLATISHGILLIITAPLNLLVTISVTVSGERTFIYNNRNMTYDKIRMFARYPQGIPPGITMTSIKK